jgi:hypothetical protein
MTSGRDIISSSSGSLTNNLRGKKIFWLVYFLRWPHLQIVDSRAV